MKHFIGLDVSMKETSICICDEKGKIVFEADCRTDPDELAVALKKQKLEIDLIGLESGSLSHWLTEELLSRDLPVKCIDARHCAAFLSMRINKTDKNDARGIAEVMRCGVYREVQVKARSLREIGALLTSRKQLVGQRTQLLLSVRGILKPFGIRLGSISKTKTGIEKLKANLQTMEIEKSVLSAISHLLEAAKVICISIRTLDKEIDGIVKESEGATRLKTIPGVGPVTALKYLIEIADPKRFKNSRSVGAYIGLTPKQYSSGETQRQSGISKCGSKSLRSLLVEAAIVLLTRTASWSKLKAWGVRLQKKVGLKKAATAVARKLAVVMHQMLMTGESFRFSDKKPEAKTV